MPGHLVQQIPTLAQQSSWSWPEHSVTFALTVSPHLSLSFPAMALSLQYFFTEWRPGRTVVLCSWDAEEFGLIGSYEWTEVSWESGILAVWKSDIIIH